MPKRISPNFREQVSATSGVEPVYLLTITHPQLTNPIRIVNDNRNFRKGSPGPYLNYFDQAYDAVKIGCSFDFTKSTLSDSMGQATLALTRTSIGTRVSPAGAIEIVEANLPRYDYDPITHGLKGVLIEEARTNILVWSSDVTTVGHPATWTKSGSLTETTVNGGIVAGATAYKYANTGALGSAPVSQQSGTFGSGTESAYVIVENVDADISDLLMFSNTGSVSLCRVRLTWATESAAIIVGSGTAYLEKMSDRGPNGGKVYKLGLSSSTASVSGLPRGLFFYPNGGNADTKGSIVHATQYEVAFFPTSYIPTAAVAVTRNTDSPILPIGTWANEGAFTIYYEFMKKSLPVSGGATAMVVARTNSARAGYIVSGTSTLSCFDGTNSTSAAVDVVPDTVSRGVFALDTSGQALCLNGGVVATTAYDGTFDSGQNFGLGCNNSGSGQLNGHLRSFIYIPYRLPNALMQALSGGQALSTFSVEYQAFAFQIQLPDDVSKQIPSVPLTFDNIGREMTQWLEASGGGKGAQVTIEQVMRNAPDVVEQSYTLTLLSVSQTMLEITGQLGYENFLDAPCLAATYTPETTPGIF